MLSEDDAIDEEVLELIRVAREGRYQINLSIRNRENELAESITSRLRSSAPGQEGDDQ